MDPGWLIWKVNCSESPNRCELGASEEGFLGNFQLDPGSEMWKGIWLVNVECNLAW